MRNPFLLGLMLMVSMACNRRHPVQINVQRDGKYTVVDSTAKATRFYAFNDNYKSAWYPVYHIGPTRNSYSLAKNPITENARDQHIDTTLRTARWSAKAISIFVDTALDLSYEQQYTHRVNEDYQHTYDMPKTVIDSTVRFKAYPVFINNTCDSTLYLGTHNYLNFTVREVKNSQGQWVAIESFGNSFECMGCRKQFLKPHEIMIAKLLRHKGKFKATCRLKFGTRLNVVYSNTFTDYIDENEPVFVPPTHN